MELKEWLEKNKIVDVTECADKAGQGSAFFAIKGTKADGADFIPDAIKNGAIAVVADHDIKCGVPVRVVKDVRRELASACSLLWPSENLKKVAVTGTNGKTSTVYFVQQLMNACGVKAVSLGTIGIDGPEGHIDGGMTTLPPKELAQTLAKLETQGVQVVAMEASSHGLDQGRMVGQKLLAGAFTNLTRDHMDYHKTFENYFDAKKNLFSEILKAGDTAVLNADISEYETLKKLAESRGEKIISYGIKGETLRLIKQEPTQNGQKITFEIEGEKTSIEVPIFGDFQAMNLMAAMGLCYALGVKWTDLLKALPALKAPAGRLELIGKTPKGALVFVDYAHTPDGLEHVLKSLRLHTKKCLMCLFGCGGDRDKGKRPQMGKIANDLADMIYVTDDNPRSENPATIRSEILIACPKGKEEKTRAEAIRYAITEAGAGDVLVLAGKGHESGQKIGAIDYPFSDRVEVAIMLKNLSEKPLWNASELQMALGVEVPEYINAYGVTFNSKEVSTGDLFIALTGGVRDGHEFVKNAVEMGASACIVNHPMDNIPMEKQIVVLDTREALLALARFARMRTTAQVVGVTGSSGKTTVKEMLGACLSAQGKTYITRENLNSNLGVPLTLANMPANTQYAVIEMGISHVGEMTELSDLVRPEVSIITNILPAHREFFKTSEVTATEKSHIFDFQDKTGTAVLNADTECAQILADQAVTAGIRRIMKFGKKEGVDYQLKSVYSHDGKQQVNADLLGEKVEFEMNFIGEHYAVDALGVLGVVDALGASVLKAKETLSFLMPMAGRGKVEEIIFVGKKILLIDDAYNANPGSMQAAIKMLGLYGGRKIAVLGDMLELGEDALKNHLDLAQVLAQNSIQAVFTLGPFMQKMREKLSKEIISFGGQKPEEVLDQLKNFVQEGDVILVKSSHGTGLWRLVEQMKGK